MLRSRLVLSVLATIVLSQLLGGNLPGCTAKEIVATHEWTVLGENDTVDAGMHIRMDLTTGEKWVKLQDQEDENEEKKHTSRSSGLSTSSELAVVQNLKVMADGSVVAVEDNKNVEEKPDYDFEMMHRTLSKLPDKEKERIGLPVQPENTKQKVTTEQRALFQEQMKLIWERRQEELRAFEDDHLADLPEILKDRIQRIRDYLTDPYTHLVGMDLQEPGNPNQVTHIVSVLKDLEYQLSDIDMARDFYTLGGWPLLLSLVSNKVHVSTNQTAEATDEMNGKVHAIQAHAAWAVGTAVKNTGEFIPFAVEKILVGEETTTAVDLLLTQFDAASKEPPSPSVVKKLQKMLYGLGALLRANRPAQVHFCASKGPEILGKTLANLVEDRSSHAVKMTKRLLNLADDIILDVELHASKSKQVDEAIVQAFSSELWCQLTAVALQGDPVIREVALRTVAALVGHCSWDMTAMQQSISQLRDDWKAEASEMHSDILQEQLELAEATIASLADITT